MLVLQQLHHTLTLRKREIERELRGSTQRGSQQSLVVIYLNTSGISSRRSQFSQTCRDNPWPILHLVEYVTQIILSQSADKFVLAQRVPSVLDQVSKTQNVDTLQAKVYRSAP
jgi:hypothetical protein